MKHSFQIIFTSDTHGRIFPVDYASGKEHSSGLLNLAGQIKKDRNTLVMDGGDSLQGTPLTQYYLEHREQWDVHPVAEAFGAAGCDYFTLGNHDFNFGYEVMEDYLNAMERVGAKCLCANVKDLDGKLKIESEQIHVLENGLKIGITGIVTDFVNVWEQPENLEKIRITDAFTAAKESLARLKEKSDLTVCIYHGGLEEDRETGAVLSDSGENIACRIARELDFDILLTGHQHIAQPGMEICGTWIVQPPANAEQFIHLEGCLEEEWIRSSLEPVTGIHKEEPYQSLLPLEQAVQEWLDQPVGRLAKTIEPEEKLAAAISGSCVAALFNQVQLEATGADFSCTSLGNTPVGLHQDVTMREICAAYLFANTLVVMEVNEEVIRQALERSASYLTLENGVPAVSEEFLKPKIEHYNYDFYAGISYTFDLRKPVGQRVVKLTKSDGTPLGSRTYKLVTSNYRASGTGGYEVLRNCPVLWRGADEMPELLTRYVRKKSPLKIEKNPGFSVFW